MQKSQPHSENIADWLKLSRAEGVGPVTASRLLDLFGSIDRIMGASVSELTAKGISSQTAEKIARSRNEFDSAAELELAEKLGVWIIHLQDQRYPTVLKRIYDPPIVLYIKGTLDKSDNLSLAMVGSRRCSLYGREQASRFAHLLGSAGFTICSGMAQGIDTAAHQGALSAKARTIAVQGCGLANIFPSENKKLFELISESGACISELPLRYEPLAENFPPRNRIIAGLSLATIVIEAGLRSGSLITARMAMENNREVMAIPGKIDSHLNQGSHSLIKQGAKLIDSIEDVMESLGYIGQQIASDVTRIAAEASAEIETPAPNVADLKLSGSESQVLNCLSKEPLHLEQIIGETDIAVGDINACLISLQIKGLVKQLPGSYFIRK